MAVHPEKYGDSLSVIAGPCDVLISFCVKGNPKKIGMFSFDVARAIAEDILAQIAEVKGNDDERN